ncbi:hypothetical protein HaLaN_04179, partial [Haematococcus lacustris]
MGSRRLTAALAVVLVACLHPVLSQRVVLQPGATAVVGNRTLILVSQPMSVAAADIYCIDAYGGRLASINTDAEYAAAHALLWQALAATGSNFFSRDCSGNIVYTYCAAFGLTNLLASNTVQYLDASDTSNMLARRTFNEFASNVRGLTGVLCQNFLINNTVAFRDPDVPRAFLCKTPTY